MPYIEIDIAWDTFTCGCGRQIPRAQEVFAVSNIGSRTSHLMCGDCVRPHVEAKKELARLPEPERGIEHRRRRVAERIEVVESLRAPAEVEEGSGTADRSRRNDLYIAQCAASEDAGLGWQSSLFAELASLSKETGSNLTDMAQAASEVSKGIPDGRGKDAKVLEVMRSICCGRPHAVDIADLAAAGGTAFLQSARVLYALELQAFFGVAPPELTDDQVVTFLRTRAQK